jgi:hypothetical protein
MHAIFAMLRRKVAISDRLSWTAYWTMGGRRWCHGVAFS